MTNKPTLTYPCPHCKKPAQLTENLFRPFCSEHCRMIDLGAWANEEYTVADYGSFEE